jgi:hypothetical protein
LDPGEPADAVTSFQALHWFAGEPFWSRLRATLRPDGLFVAAGYAWFSVSPEVDAAVEGLLPALDPYWAPGNRLLMQGFAGLDVPFPEVSAPRFEIAVDWTRDELLAYLATWSAVVRSREVEGRDLLAGIAATLHEAWPDEVPRRVRMPVAVRAFRNPG